MKTVVAGALGECVHVAGVMNFLHLAEAVGWRTVFLDPAVPVEYKLHIGVENWVLRQAFAGILPTLITSRPKSKFWQGAGVENVLEEVAERNISDSDFSRESLLPNGWVLNSKEELYYYRIFRDHFGVMDTLDWMGGVRDLQQSRFGGYDEYHRAALDCGIRLPILIFIARVIDVSMGNLRIIFVSRGKSYSRLYLVLLRYLFGSPLSLRLFVG